ncbi:hypothetical protein [Hamadaea tsunoensis]|uniref:hypothetical protein n=1 Tax=Hamadaea tsunoensis TaxID=53368 RepID=UPI00040BB7A1|nr:hypothetical protein [Hamadaea tsunoensis]
MPPLRRWIGDAAAVVAYVAGAVLVFGRLLVDPSGRVLGNADDQILFEWMFAHSARVGTNPFLSSLLGVPTVANLAGNTSAVAIGLPLAWLTKLAGPGATFAAFAVLALAGTAIGWYVLLRTKAGLGRVPAFVGGLFCGFAPGLVSQADGHPHIAAQFLVPVMIWLVLWPEGPVWRSILLGAVVGVQILIGEEVLFLLALALAAYIAVYAIQRPREVRARVLPTLKRVGLAVPVALVVAGYPLYLQYFSEYAYSGIPNGIYSADLASYFAYSTGSLAGGKLMYAPNASEQTAFFGVPLVIVLVVAAVALWRRVWVRTAAIMGLLFALASLGEHIKYRGRTTGIPGPWRIVGELPIFRDVIPARLALIVVPVAGILLAVSWAAAAERAKAGHRFAWYAWPVVVSLALLPALPGIAKVTSTGRVPEFIASGEWRDCAPEGTTLVGYAPVTTWKLHMVQMRWQVAADLGYASPNGYYIARDETGEGRWGQPNRPLDLAVMDGRPITREQAAADLAYWQAKCVVVDQTGKNAEVLRDRATAALGAQPQQAGGVWYWKLP